MERLRDSARRGKSLEAGETRRQRTKPNIANSLEDFGSSFSQQQYSRAGARPLNVRSSKNAFNDGKHASSISGYSSESEDELLLSSQPSQMADDEDDLWGTSSNRKRQKRRNIQEALHGPQSEQPPKPNFHTSVIVKTLNFKKNKTNEPSSQSKLSAGRALRPPPPRKLLEKSKDGARPVFPSDAKPINSEEDSVSSDYSRCKPVAPPVASSRLKPRPINRQTFRRELTLEEIPANSQTTSLPRVSGTPAESSKPSGRAVACIKKPVIIDMISTRRSTLTQVLPIVSEELSMPNSSTARVRMNLHQTKSAIKKPKYSKIIPETESSAESSPSPVTKPKEFPMTFPLSSTERDVASKNTSTPDLNSNRTKRGVKPSTPQPFPMSFTAKGNGEASPRDKSDNGHPKTRKPKPKPRRINPKEVHNADRLSDGCQGALGKRDKSLVHPTPQPFPMSTQVLNSLGPDDSISVQQVKSSSDEGVYHGGYEWEEDFSATLTVDPNLLCPFCDALLPAPVTALLRKLIDNALRRSRHDPRPGNPLGRTAPSAVFITVCQRHRFESEELPRAQANGWPNAIDWKSLATRIMDMQSDLQRLLRDLRAGRGVSLIWKDVKLDLQAKGSRVVTSLREQFANFEKAQVGYYGELGYAIIHQTLLDIFPPTSCDLEFVKPLTPEQFIQCVLVPEVAVRLIQEDMDIYGASAQLKALQVLRDSSKYGVAMFPDEGTDNPKSLADPDQLGVADLIVMERAKKRRKEIEEEFQREQEEELRHAEGQRMEEAREKRRNDSRSGRRKKLATKGIESSSEERDYDMEISRPKPRPIQRNRSTSQSSPLLRESTTDYSCYEELEDRMSFPRPSQGSEVYLDYDLPTGQEGDILVPDSEGEGNNVPLVARVTRRNLSKTTANRMPTPFAEVTSSKGNVEIKTPVSRRRKKHYDNRESEDRENTPKPPKFRRTGLLGLSPSSSQPLLQVRRRHQQPSGNEFASTIAIAGSSSVDGPNRGLQRKSTMGPDFHWLLSDSSQERP